MCITTFDGACLNRESGAEVKYFDDPVINSRFIQFIDLFSELIEKYGGDMVFPEGENESWEINFQTVHDMNSNDILTNHDAA